MMIGVLITSLLMLVVGGSGVLGMGAMSDSAEEITKAAPLIDAAMEMKVATREHQLMIMEMLGAADEKEVTSLWAEEEAVTRWFRQFSDAVLNGAETDEGRIYPTTDPRLREVVTTARRFHDEELLPRIVKIRQLMSDEFASLEAATAAMREVEAACEAMAELSTRISERLREHAAMGGEGAAAAYPWRDRFADFRTEVMRTRISLEEFGQGFEAQAREEIRAGYARRSQRVEAMLAELIAGVDAHGVPMPPLDEPFVAEQLKELSVILRERFFPVAERYMVMLDRRAEIERDRYVFDHEADEYAERVFEMLGEVEEVARGVLGEASAASSASAERATMLSTSALIAGVLLTVVLGMLTAFGITRPLRGVIEGLRDIAQGEGDLTRRLPEESRNELGELARWFNVFVTQIQEMVLQLGTVSGQLASAAEQSSVITGQTSDGVKRQHLATDQVAAAMKQMAASVDEVARNGAAAARATGEAGGETERSKAVVLSTIERINGLAEEVTGAADIIQHLARDSDNIGGVLDVIREIADQTNLLALNAAIEAARAGDQGRGFAVVADEVRTLAQRTQESTDEIQQMIGALQEQARRAVEAMEVSREHAQEGSAEASHAGGSLEEITRAVSRIEGMILQVAGASEEQNAVAAEVVGNIQEISVISEQTAAGAEEISKASLHLSGLAGELQGLVGRFRA